MQPELDRGYVQRVRVAQLGSREVALIEVRIPGETVHLVCAAGMGIGAVDAERRDRLREAFRASAAPAGTTNALWRARFEGASVVRIGRRSLELAREGHSLLADTGPESRPESRAACGIDARLRVAEGVLADADAAPRDELERRGAAIAGELANLGTAGRRDALRRAIGKAVAKVARRLAAVQGDLTKIQGADALAVRAQFFVSAAASAPRGTDRLHAVDWTSGQALPVELPIDPSRSAREQIDALFKRARRLKEGGRIAQDRLALTRASLATLEGALADLERPATDLESLESRARAAAPRDFKLAQGLAAAPRNQPAPPRLPYRTFVGVSGLRILVGRSAAHNDALTLRFARPHDLWLHAREASGAHVVVSLTKGMSCPPDVLAEAAHLAAHFSRAKDERIVDVVYAPRRYLRKPRGSAPGLVVVDREKVFVLRMSDEVLRRLLASEIV